MKHQVEVFSAGCPLCTPVVDLVMTLGKESADVTVLDTHNPVNAERARMLNVRRLPAVVINGKLASCCTTGGCDENVLRAALA